MSKFTKGILTFCGITLLLGGVLFGIGKHFGEQTEQNPWFGEDVLWGMDVTVDGAKIQMGEKVESIEKQESPLAFENIHMEVECGNVQVVKGSEFQISCIYPEKEMPEFKVENNTLEVTQKNCLNTGNATRSIIITVPEQAQLLDMTFENEVGDVTITGITADSYTTTLSTGSVAIQSSDLERCMLTVDTGSIDISDLSADYCGVSTSTGEINIKDCDVKEYVLINDVGDTTLDLSSVSYDYAIKAKTDVGKVYMDGEKKSDDYEMDAVGDYRIEIRKDVGDINIRTK